MAIIKRKPDTTDPEREDVEQQSLNNSRRSFIWKAGAVISTAIGSAVLSVKPGYGKTPDNEDRISQLSNRIGQMVDTDKIRNLQNSYSSSLDLGLYEAVVDMFVEDGEVIFNSERYSGRDTGIRRLYCKLFRDGRSGKRITPSCDIQSIPGFETGFSQHQDTVEVADGRMSANGRFLYSMQVGVPMAIDCSLVEMARLQGEGIEKWWEGGICKASYLKIDDIWKIKKLAYQACSRVKYGPNFSRLL